MSDDATDDEAPEYDPAFPTPPARAPPHRRTAPQSDYTMGQVGVGIVVLIVGLVVTVGLPVVLA